MKTRRILFLIAIVSLLILTVFASVAFGAKAVSINSIISAFLAKDSSSYEVSVVLARFPRTAFGLIAGAALAISGVLMQALTGNPIADPSILGVNTGASLFVVVGIAFLNIQTGFAYIWLAFIGATVTAVFVYGLSSIGGGGVTPIKLALAGAAASTALSSLTIAIMLPNNQVMDRFRFWQSGSIGGAGWNDISLLLPFLIIGFILSIYLSSSLNVLAMGDEVATGLGVHIGRVRILSAFAGVLLCASTTALAGPIGFIGLMVPHFVRMIFGNDLKWVIPVSAITGAVLLLFADVLGRMINSPGELEVGIVTAIMGAPIFILICKTSTTNMQRRIQ